MGRQAVPCGLAQDAPLIAPTLFPSDFRLRSSSLESADVAGFAWWTFDDGFGPPSALEKLRKLRGLVSAEYVPSVDGGFWPSTIAVAAQTGICLSPAGGEVFDACEHGWTSGVPPQIARLGVPWASLE
jgi:hypothetical protein